jgi:putative monooxygenase
LRPEQGLLIPAYMRHRFRNAGDEEARLLFHLGPLAPTPQLGHVDTEETEAVAAAAEGAGAGGARPADRGQVRS